MLRRKRSSQGSGADDGVFGDLLNARVDWRKVLRDFVTETCAGRDESSWRRPNRRFIADDVYMPSVIGTQMSELVIGFDTSGSCFGGADMTRFVSEIRTLLEDVKPAKCRVVYWDTEVTGEQVFENGQFAVHSLKPKGGAGLGATCCLTTCVRRTSSPMPSCSSVMARLVTGDIPQCLRYGR